MYMNEVSNYSYYLKEKKFKKLKSLYEVMDTCVLVLFYFYQNDL